MKRTVTLLLLFILLTAFGASGEVMPPSSPIPTENAAPPDPSPTGIYSAKLWDATVVYAEMSMESAKLGAMRAGAEVVILLVEPDWLMIAWQGGLGYIRRGRVDDASVDPLDPANTPDYAALPCGFIAWTLSATPVLDAPENSAKTLVMLEDGARLAVADVTDGWARLIYHRQWAYVSTLNLREIAPVNQAQGAGSDAPIAAYTSFYKLTTDESNRNRINNLRVACLRMESIILQPGDTLNFNDDVGPWSRRNGYLPANVIVQGEIVQGYGGGTCQVSSTLYNVVLQLPGVYVIRRRAHGMGGAAYLPLGADAAVGSFTQNFIIKNLYPFPIRMDGTVQDGALTVAIYRAD